MVEKGQTTFAGHAVPYTIRRLPVSSFPDLPASVVGQLDQRGCMIPQTYEAHHPENVVHASLERSGSSDWAVLCSAHGAVTLLVFFGSTPTHPTELAQTAETKRLQRYDSSGIYGFNWGIDIASSETLHDAQLGSGRTPRLDHDGLADTVVDRAVRYHVYVNHEWTIVTPDG